MFRRGEGGDESHKLADEEAHGGELELNAHRAAAQQQRRGPRRGERVERRAARARAREELPRATAFLRLRLRRRRSVSRAGDNKASSAEAVRAVRRAREPSTLQHEQPRLRRRRRSRRAAQAAGRRCRLGVVEAYPKVVTKVNEKLIVAVVREDEAVGEEEPVVRQRRLAPCGVVDAELLPRRNVARRRHDERCARAVKRAHRVGARRKGVVHHIEQRGEDAHVARGPRVVRRRRCRRRRASLNCRNLLHRRNRRVHIEEAGADNEERPGEALRGGSGGAAERVPLYALKHGGHPAPTLPHQRAERCGLQRVKRLV